MDNVILKSMGEVISVREIKALGKLNFFESLDILDFIESVFISYCFKERDHVELFNFVDIMLSYFSHLLATCYQN